MRDSHYPEKVTPGVSQFSGEVNPEARTEIGTQPPSETHVHLDKETAHLAMREQERHTFAYSTRPHMPSLPGKTRTAGRQSKAIGFINAIQESKLLPVLAQGNPEGSALRLDDSQPTHPTPEVRPLGGFGNTEMSLPTTLKRFFVFRRYLCFTDVGKYSR